MKENIIKFIKETYGVSSEYLWASTPENAIFRNPHNGKWFAVLIGNLPKSKLGVNSTDKVNVLNLKCDPMLSYSFIDNQRIFKGYHMNKEHWISVLLNNSVPMEEVKMLIDMSYEIVNSK